MSSLSAPASATSEFAAAAFAAAALTLVACGERQPSSADGSDANDGADPSRRAASRAAESAAGPSGGDAGSSVGGGGGGSGDGGHGGHGGGGVRPPFRVDGVRPSDGVVLGPAGGGSGGDVACAAAAVFRPMSAPVHCPPSADNLSPAAKAQALYPTSAGCTPAAISQVVGMAGAAAQAAFSGATEGATLRGLESVFLRWRLAAASLATTPDASHATDPSSHASACAALSADTRQYAAAEAGGDGIHARAADELRRWVEALTEAMVASFQAGRCRGAGSRPAAGCEDVDVALGRLWEVREEWGRRVEETREEGEWGAGAEAELLAEMGAWARSTVRARIFLFTESRNRRLRVGPLDGHKKSGQGCVPSSMCSIARRRCR